MKEGEQDVKSVQELLESCKNTNRCEYRSNVRTVMNYISNCLSVFGVELKEFKDINKPKYYNVNVHLEESLKDKISNYFDFPNKSEFKRIKEAPGHYQEFIYEIIKVVKSFLNDNFQLECYKDLVDKINKNIEEMIKLLDETNEKNADFVARTKDVMKMFNFIVCSEERTSYFTKVYRAFKNLPECNNDELLTEDEIIVLDFIKLNTQLNFTVENLKQESLISYCTK